ncbi:uncharacterized protein F4822DRAFT_303427 [Hypoxylon trugodes]|uniref:uncharacterized protein n=1 Tax=Hypoxylon trugodes TaxID=326681 RepID=UPI00219E3427|nr:uncharacterized protein F4822DRAFT_303427 [Hypoxylon trugodes]KAI1388138.1 hypothetical protein F4822DRAFT_303427 [Hypoxylon trugodes]
MSDNVELPPPTDPNQPPKTNVAIRSPGESKVVIDPDGDLNLVVGSRDSRTFVVCSKALARASPVWKTLLYGGFAESIQPDRSTGKEWIVNLPDDDAAAVQIILNILHYRFDEIPISAHTILSDKYDLTRLLRPWVRGWRDGLAECVKTETLTVFGIECLSWITWELGFGD